MASGIGHPEFGQITAEPYLGQPKRTFKKKINLLLPIFCFFSMLIMKMEKNVFANGKVAKTSQNRRSLVDPIKG